MSSSAEEEEEMKLLLSESLHSRSDNLNELIRLHRARNKYELVDKFYNKYIRSYPAPTFTLTTPCSRTSSTTTTTYSSATSRT